MPRSSVKNFNIIKVPNKNGFQKDLLAVEEPLEIRVWHWSADQLTKTTISVTMRTPGHDFELAAGFLFTEGVIDNYGEIEVVRYCEDVDTEEALNNIVIVELKKGKVLDLEKLERNFYMTSSCGVCGKASIEAIQNQNCPVIPVIANEIDPNLMHLLPEKLKQHQINFNYTGGIHAAALFSTEGDLLLSREDVGRHNAVDKLVGAALHSQILGKETLIMLVSGRASFELVQKAVMASIGVLAAVGAPSSLAVDTAINFNLTLVGFLRNNRFNIYSNHERFLKSLTS